MATRRNKLQKAHRKVSGFNALRRNIKKYGDNLGAELQKIAVETGLRVQDAATGLLMTGTGRAPDPKTFELARSVRMVVLKRSVRVGTSVMHGFYQEFGTVQHKAHPWLYPSMRLQRGFYEARLKSLHAAAMKGIDPDEDD